ncbi:hypothetical protein H4Q32_017688 [Labeo rohita]|uniref:CCHC-type domain-containing protein n=1 Tax=Labeo rohita TaxID=84645 RepID=A0ABQ8LXE2_LABRO|nr:hypothetical protein H4Q32_017688 [Labeo rohita]
MVLLKIDFNRKERGPGVWVLNTELLKSESYKLEIENLIEKEKEDGMYVQDKRIWWENLKDWMLQRIPDFYKEVLNGLEIKGIKCETKKLQDREYVVSFIYLPAYLEDSDILDKLEGWRVIPTSQIRRRYYPETDIKDGTRFVKVKFPREVASLPYSTRFGTAEGTQHFRIIHSQQVKTCRLCMSPQHILKDCPEFTCYKCEEQGHFVRDCTAVKCPDCFKILNKGECWMNSGEEEEEAEEEEEEEQEDSGQMLKEAMETKAVSEPQEVAIEEEKGNGKELVNTNEGEKSVEKESIEEGVWTPADIATNTMDKHNAAENS